MSQESWKGVPVEFQLLPKGTRRSGQKLRKGKPEFLVAHDTGNINTTAQNNVDYYRNSYNIDISQTASAHVFVDDKHAIVCVPLNEKAWHVLYNATTDNKWYGVDANDGAVGVEICYFTDKKRSQKSLENGAKVLAYLAEKNDIHYQTEMPGHQDIQSNKQDPGNVLQAAGYGRATSNLDKIVAKYYKKDVKVKPIEIPDTKSKPKTTIGKTQSYINKRLKTYLNGTVDSPNRVKSRTYREPGFLPMEKGAIDVDRRFNAQCVDVVKDYIIAISDGKLQTWGNARDYVNNNLEPYFTWHKNTPSFVPPKGSIGIATFGTPAFNQYGHIWIVEKANRNTQTVIEQNLNGQANLPPKRRVDNYYGCAGFWVPNVRKNVVQKAVEKTKNTVAKTQTIKTTWDWSGKFNAGTTIKVRKQPGLAGQILNRDRWLEKNDSVEFVSITKKDNYWWIKFKQDGEFVYCAITKMTDLKGRIKYEKDLFGTIKWY
ncbi:N-acetylmuramoyl-L-alanine amidase [Staphylococcus hsinchuensis]|uniref:N-acetylmuramoyl-L-alanine amidase n=1 Tax=Staphylococcus hsinchuensis TaxID=3051183 RepID=A0ABZ3E9W4_9STAP